MKAVGIVVEYNPFHNGHAFHLEKTREKANADVVIAVMSGQFLQRGEPALLPKWSRTKMALLAGVDIVLELPYQFATQKADTFAHGAVSILASAGCDALCFGSESGDIAAFNHTINFLESNHGEYQSRFKLHIEKGVSYPKALSSAFNDLNPSESLVDLSKPNNILGYQYVKAIRDQNLHMKPITISRTNAGYHDEDFSSETIASATSIRKALFSKDGRIENVLPYVPAATAELLEDYYIQAGQLHQWENYWPYLKFRLLQSTPEELRMIYEVEEGLENRILAKVLEAESFSEFMKAIKTKRYTWTRLQRVCVHILTNTTNDEMKIRMKNPSYIRLLGMNDVGRSYLNKWKLHTQIPIISKMSSYQENDILLDIRSSRIYALGASPAMRSKLMKMDYEQPPIYIK
ncbi:nucleotidyltransferase [Bacillus dakarensis]|uniref:nucleotidyltransferase n=1 Tax=Robertmurraya dakarensis TaxID=1926278 RepID=UPI0009819324|nr:nucleotidyltransferase [Bacillus dakarensis]